MKEYKVLWTFIAKKDLEKIIDNISKDSVEIAIKKYGQIKETSKRLKKYHEQRRIIPELSEQNIMKYCEIIISPWRLMYKIEKNIVCVMAVIDGRRNEDILLKR